MSFQDSAFIFFIALLLFGPKKLPELARQLGKLMGEFRRASNEFRMQLEDELRTSEQAEKQKKIAALEAAKITESAAPALDVSAVAVEDHAALPAPSEPSGSPVKDVSPISETAPSAAASTIATAGGLELHAPTTGLPVARNNSVGQVFDSLPEAPPDRSVTTELHRSESSREADQGEPAHHG